MAEREEPTWLPWFRGIFIPAIIPAYFVVPREHHTALSLTFLGTVGVAAVYRTWWRKRRGLPPASSADVG